MRALLVVLTALEIIVFLGALVLYINWVAASLRHTADSLGKVAFGVRAIETQTAPIGPGVTKINGQLATIAGALDGVAVLAEQAGGTGTSGRRPQPRKGRDS